VLAGFHPFLRSTQTTKQLRASAVACHSRPDSPQTTATTSPCRGCRLQTSFLFRSRVRGSPAESEVAVVCGRGTGAVVAGGSRAVRDARQRYRSAGCAMDARGMAGQGVDDVVAFSDRGRGRVVGIGSGRQGSTRRFRRPPAAGSAGTASRAAGLADQPRQPPRREQPPRGWSPTAPSHGDDRTQSSRRRPETDEASPDRWDELINTNHRRTRPRISSGVSV